MPFDIYPIFPVGSHYGEAARRDLKDLLLKITPFFPDLHRISTNTKAAVIAHSASKSDYLFKGSLAQCYIPSIPRHFRLLTPILSYIGIKLAVSDFDYVIVLSNEAVTFTSKIEKTFTIAHEIQHIFQFGFFRAAFLRCGILQFYYYLKNGSFDRNTLPHEIDAIRIAKKINYDLYGKKEVDDFLTGKMVLRDKEYQYWESINQIDTTSSPDFHTEIESLWNSIEFDIESTLEISRTLIELHDYYLSEIGRINE